MSATVTPAPYERPRGRGSNLVFKSGPLYISSKGLGWKSWKRRWFILTRTSLMFFKNDPNVLPQKGGDSHTLGGIDLNNSGSVIVGAAKKLTVLFPDGRAFTLKAETMDDVDEWKVALERALAAAPNAALVVGHNGIFRNDSIDAIEGTTEQGRERSRVKSVVVGRPILLALEDIDGSPTFLEKALCFLETYGLGVEGILRQSADVDEVERRVRDYEQGHTEFGPDEDAHVMGDCIKHILRELPSSPVPTPCCTALLEAHRLDGKEARVASMRIAVAETFPEPNRRLLQRVLRMMRAVASHTSENRMTPSAVAACMAPLLLRPLLAGECGLDDESDISGDNAAQLLAATTAANNAQAIVTTLLEEYDNIFEDDTLRDPPSPNMYANLDGSGSDEESEEDGVLGLRDVDGYHDAQNDLDAEVDEDFDRVMSGGLSESSGHVESDVFDYKVYEGGDSDFDSPKGVSRAKNATKGWTRSVRSGNHDRAGAGSTHHDNGGGLNASSLGLGQLSWDSVSPVTSPRVGAGGPPGPGPGSGVSLRTKGHASIATSRRTSLWGITTSSAKPVSVDMTDSSEEELAIQRLEATRNELRNKIQKEAKGNAVLQASLERRKQALHDRRLALEQDVSRLQSQLQMERDLRAALEAGLSMSAAQMTSAQSLDSKTRAELEEIAVVEADVARLKQKVAELHLQLSLQKQQQGGSLTDASERHERVRNLQSQQALLQQELDLTLALCHQEKQKNDEQLEEHSGQEDTTALETFVQQQRNALAEAKEALMAERNRGQDLRGRRPSVGSRGDDSAGGDWRTLRPPAGPSAAGRQFAWRQHKPDAGSLNDASSKVIESAMELPNGGGYSSDGGASTSSGKRSNLEVEGVIVNSMRASPHHPAASPSAALAELTTRLDFFKERRSQLMEQLHTLDPTLVPPSLNGHDLIPASPLQSP